MGPDFPLMVDCYMSLSVPYAIDLAQRLSPLGLKWMEEYLSARKPRRCPPPPLALTHTAVAARQCRTIIPGTWRSRTR